MKIQTSIHSTTRSRKSGFSVILMLALLGLVLAFIAANSQTLSGLGSDLKRLEQKQIRRLNESVKNASPNAAMAMLTNAPPGQTTVLTSK